MNRFNTLWKFSRPHTIIGSVISIFTLHFILCDNRDSFFVFYLIRSIIIGVCCNIYIVGINQIADIEIDKINKPYLPLASGVLHKKDAWYVVITAIMISFFLALSISFYLFVIIILAAFIGWAYSLPPFYLKKNHVTAALAIATVRGVLLNACGFMVFNKLINNSMVMPENVKILTIFIIAFSIVISWFKDLSDIKGDLQYQIKTLAISYSSKTALLAGNLLIAIAYVFTIIVNIIRFTAISKNTIESQVLLFGHIILFVLFITNAFSIRLNENESIKKFYQRFWWFFFAEYLLYLFAYALKRWM